MTTALLAMTLSNGRLRVLAVRRHAALVRALLVDLERLVPSAGASEHEEVMSEQLVEEVGPLGHRLLECTTTTIETPGVGTARLAAVESNGGGRW
jgi:hypothetical protein